MTSTSTLADDLLIGADAIAEFVFGKSDSQARRKVYHASSCGYLRVFKMGQGIAARKSELVADLSADRKRGG